MAKITKKSIFLHFFGQKICTFQKNVLPLHRQIKKSAKISQFAISKNTIQNATTIQKDCKTAAKIIQKFDINKKSGNKIPKKNFLQPKNSKFN